MRRTVVTLAALCCVSNLSSCGVDPNEPAAEPEIATTGAAPSFERWAAANTRKQGELYYLEGDFGLTEEQLHQYYDTRVVSSGGLMSYTSGGALTKFSTTEQHAITYCVDSDDFTAAQRTTLNAFLDQAMGAWEAVAGVSYLPRGDSSGCDTSSALIRVIAMAEDGTDTNGDGVISDSEKSGTEGLAASGNPPGGGRILNIKRSVVTGNQSFLLAVLQHELGHTLGFAHEHPRSTSETYDPDPDLIPTTGYLTPRDTSSVMYYTNKPGYSGNPGGPWNYITQWDLEGSQKVYGAPTDVVNKANGEVYARSLTTHDFYRRESNGSWTKIGGPGQAFVSVSNALYAQTPVGGTIVKYSAPNNWWYGTGAASGNGQLLRCVDAVCTTNPLTKQIARYNGSGWTYIGGAGLRFAGTETELFGIRPQQNGVALWSGEGATWWMTDSGEQITRELAGGGTYMLRIPSVNFGAIERFNGTAWSQIGSFTRLRQVHATGSFIYALNGNAVMKYNGAFWGWSRIDDEGALTKPLRRLYGSYGRLYGLATDGTIYSFSPNSEPFEPHGTWTSLGAP